MEHILPQYQQLERTTWTYISSLMTIALYFKFSRLWSVRNLDLAGLIALGPGLLLASSDGNAREIGFSWVFAMELAFLVRMLLDPMMVRRPLLEPNLSPGGLTFMGASLLVFLMAHVLNGTPQPADLAGAERWSQVMNRERVAVDDPFLRDHGPGYGLLFALGELPNRLLMRIEGGQAEMDEQSLRTAAARTMAILAHLGVVTGMVLVGARHFGNIRTGVAGAGLYLLIPYTAQTIGRVDHALPAALLIWIVVLYRRPLLAGMMLGLAAGTIYYPLFLVPLWIGFYWPRGLVRFLAGLGLMGALLVASLALTAVDAAGVWDQFKQMGGWATVVEQLSSGQVPGAGSLGGFWSYHEPAYRIPVFVLFAVLSASLCLWPARKNLGTLLSCSAAIMLGVQFWHGGDGGMYVGWFLPMLLLAVLRPNLEDRVALAVLHSGWLPRRGGTASAGRAA